MDDEQAFPVIRQTVLDTTDPRRLAEFYRLLFGLRYRPGDEPPGPGQPDPKGQGWLVLRSPAGGAALAFQKVGEGSEATWPDGPVPQQLHLDTTVPTAASSARYEATSLPPPSMISASSTRSSCSPKDSRGYPPQPYPRPMRHLTSYRQSSFRPPGYRAKVPSR